MEREMFKKVYIKSEADLPKERDYYVVHRKGSDCDYPTAIQFFLPKNATSINVWNDYDWYLRPVPQPERKMAEDILEKHFPLVIADKDEWAIEVLKCMSEYAAQGIDWPSEEESNKILDKKAFRVPYDGSDNFYDESFIKGWKACYEWLLNRVKK